MVQCLTAVTQMSLKMFFNIVRLAALTAFNFKRGIESLSYIIMRDFELFPGRPTSYFSANVQLRSVRLNQLNSKTFSSESSCCQFL